MTLLIKQKDSIAIKFWLPTSFLKSKLILKLLNKYTDTTYISDLLPMLYSSLKKYIKLNGHFTFISIESNDGEKLEIFV